MAPSVRVLKVFLQQAEIGSITLLPHERSIFAFTDAYVEESNRSVLSLSYKTADGGIDASVRPTRTKVPPFFSNLLPEGHLRDYLAGLAGVNPQREFFLLWLLGEDLPGAVVVRDIGGEALPPQARRDSHDSRADTDLMRFSLAGVQLKFSAIRETDGGLTIPATGTGGDWIIKLPSPRFQAVPEVEFAMMKLARAVGIEVPEVFLIESEEVLGLPPSVNELGKALAVRRFDRREDHTRVHIEDFAQVFNVFPDRKYKNASYEQIAKVLWAEAGLESVVEMARRLAFSALIGNADMHLKNWSVIYPDGRTARLSPGYDFVPTIAYIPTDTEMALSMGGSREMYSVDVELFRRFAAKAGIPELPVIEAAEETAEKVRNAWKTFPAAETIPSRMRALVTEHLTRIPLGINARSHPRGLGY